MTGFQFAILFAMIITSSCAWAVLVERWFDKRRAGKPEKPWQTNIREAAGSLFFAFLVWVFWNF
jgi:hypothetical protein